jgi:hypothetical protein
VLQAVPNEGVAVHSEDVEEDHQAGQPSYQVQSGREVADECRWVDLQEPHMVGGGNQIRLMAEDSRGYRVDEQRLVDNAEAGAQLETVQEQNHCLGGYRRLPEDKKEGLPYLEEGGIAVVEGKIVDEGGRVGEGVGHDFRRKAEGQSATMPFQHLRFKKGCVTLSRLAA